jgi:hypothetical protein
VDGAYLGLARGLVPTARVADGVHLPACHGVAGHLAAAVGQRATPANLEDKSSRSKLNLELVTHPRQVLLPSHHPRGRGRECRLAKRGPAEGALEEVEEERVALVIVLRSDFYPCAEAMRVQPVVAIRRDNGALRERFEAHRTKVAVLAEARETGSVPVTRAHVEAPVTAGVHAAAGRHLLAQRTRKSAASLRDLSGPCAKTSLAVGFPAVRAAARDDLRKGRRRIRILAQTRRR